MWAILRREAIRADMRTFKQLHGKGRELDIEIARRIFGKSEQDYHCPHKLFCGCPALPHYSRIGKDAWKVVEELTANLFYEFHLCEQSDYLCQQTPSWSASFRRLGTTVGEASAEICAQAICLAALKVVESG